VTTKLACALASMASMTVEEAAGAGVTTSSDATRPGKGTLHGSAGGAGGVYIGAFGGSLGSASRIVR